MSSTSSSLGRNSMIMASGTAASRVTGQVRTILLAAALGTTGLAANAYQAGAMIPQAVFSLVSGGIFNAVLVPQIVRTLQEKDAEDRLNKLITLAITMLLGVTVIMAVATPLLTMLYVGGSPELMALTNAFTLWCMPQIFFYGLYTVLGQILAAKDHFGTYAWSSVGANLISCAGFISFILLFGRAAGQPPEFWTPGKLALTAGTWTLGVAFQALVLFLPLARCGIRYRPRWGVSGIGLRSMGSVAGWSIAIVIVDQLINIVVTRINTSAPDSAHEMLGISTLDVAGNATYQNAFTLYMLPYSLIAVSVATALFPKISRAIAEHDVADARGTLSQSLRNVGVLMIFFSVAFIVMPAPIILALLPSISAKEAALIATPLMMLGIGLPVASAYLIIQRTFYAFEDGRTPFMFMVLYNTLLVVFLLVGMRFVPPTHWITLVAIGSPISHLVAFPFLIPSLKRRFEGSMDGRRIAVAYGKALFAAFVATVAGLLLRGPVYALLGVRTVMGAATDNGSHAAAAVRAVSMNWLQAVGVCVLLTIVITVAYVGMLWLLRSQELLELSRPLIARFIRKPVAATDATDTADADDSTNTANGNESAADRPTPTSEPPAPPTVPTAYDSRHDNDSNAAATTTPTARMTPKPPEPPASPSLQYGVRMNPQLGDTILNRYTLVSPLRDEPGLLAWKASDRVLSRDCQLFIVTDRKAFSQVTATASFMASLRDPRLTQVLQLHHDDQIVVVVMQDDAGMSMTDYLLGSERHVLTYDAMRSVIGELIDIIHLLQSRGIDHYMISTDTVRVTASGIQLTAVPISTMLMDTADNDGRNLNVEQRDVRQLASLLYSMLTRTPSNTMPDYSFDRLSGDMPGEFRLICKRGLGMKVNDSDVNLPMSSMAEIEALLGPWTPLTQLTGRDIALPGINSLESIITVPMRRSNMDDIVPVPSAIVSSGPLPPLSMSMPQYSSALTSDDVVDVTPMTGDLFRAFDGSKPNNGNNTTLAINVSAVRNPHPEETAGERTAVVQPVAAAAAKPQESSLEETQIIPPLKAEAEQEAPISVPPSIKTSNMVKAYKAAEEEDFANESLLGNLPTKIITVLVGIIAVVGAGFLAINFLNNSQPNIGGSGSNQSDPWDESNIDSVPFGNGTNGSSDGSSDGNTDSNSSSSSSNTTSGNNSSNGSDKSDKSSTSDKSSSSSSSSSDGKHEVVTKDKEAKKVPDPKYQNNTPLTISSQNFLDNPGGQNGFAYHLHLDKSQKVYRMKITITTSGGKGYVITNSASDPTKGDRVAEFTFAEGGTTEITFTKVSETQDVLVWVPLDSLPNNQLYIQKVELF
ncbi:lipid II flippase MurJ [Bifidobacterium ramosum]|uniref:Lipid II flippase MurJ n=2 Tax=Bifidobacterium ramosum TaxID=1798158 RepID=A0A6L4WYV4_9BIFI|nr:murein biosynthesis integral membrane protein MurJ [Bifidobacterium ramosum]KAB8287307.1 lipid II flippase MurJ [Bifidobacterium ramosum]